MQSKRRCTSAFTLVLKGDAWSRKCVPKVRRCCSPSPDWPWRKAGSIPTTSWASAAAHAQVEQHPIVEVNMPQVLANPLISLQWAFSSKAGFRDRVRSLLQTMQLHYTRAPIATSTTQRLEEKTIARRERTSSAPSPALQGSSPLCTFKVWLLSFPTSQAHPSTTLKYWRMGHLCTTHAWLADSTTQKHIAEASVATGAHEHDCFAHGLAHR